jgi:hypothetical protein
MLDSEQGVGNLQAIDQTQPSTAKIQIAQPCGLRKGFTGFFNDWGKIIFKRTMFCDSSVEKKGQDTLGIGPLQSLPMLPGTSTESMAHTVFCFLKQTKHSTQSPGTSLQY